MTLRRVGLSNSLSSQAKISNRRFTLSRVSLRRFPFPTAAAAAAVVNYVEEVFSTYLYTGNGGTQTITNGIDLSTKGGLVWSKRRVDTIAHLLADTVRGRLKTLSSNTTGAEFTAPGNNISSFNTNGYTVQDGWDDYNVSTKTYVSWTFRKQQKFFDIVTYTGNGVARTISHNLGSTPGCIIIKNLSESTYWAVYHRGITTSGGPTASALFLNRTDAATSADSWNNTAPTNTVFSVGSNNYETNLNGSNYVAYLFAHDAGGFGATGSDNVISCGSYTGNGSSTGPVINLGYEPQLVLVKHAGGGATNAGQWWIQDNMRGLGGSGSTGAPLWAESTNSESAIGSADWMEIGATYFQPKNAFYGINESGATYIYIAIRRGPMKTPTSGTSVFSPVAYTGTSAARVLSAGFPVDLTAIKNRSGTGSAGFFDRLRGNGILLQPDLTSAEVNNSNFAGVIGIQDGTTFPGSSFNNSAFTWINWAFRRAPGFFDVVCYSGNSVNGRTVTHNLGVTPQLIIVKPRTIVVNWSVYAEPAGNTLQAPLNAAERFTSGINCWNNTSPTASVFSLSNNAQVNRTGDTYVAYLFATCTGVSKVGSYTGTGALQTVDCGFSAGARFVLIHRIDVNADWYVWDSARGITSGNDPYLLLNSTAAEVTTTNYVDTDSTGFKVTAAAPAGLNASGGSYLFLAIA